MTSDLKGNIGRLSAQFVAIFHSHRLLLSAKNQISKTFYVQGQFPFSLSKAIDLGDSKMELSEGEPVDARSLLVF